MRKVRTLGHVGNAGNALWKGQRGVFEKRISGEPSYWRIRPLHPVLSGDGKPKSLIAVSHGTGGYSAPFTLLYYPAQSDLSMITRLSSDSAPGSYAGVFRDSVASLHVIPNQNERAPAFEIDSLQAHFKVPVKDKSHQTGKPSSYTRIRSLATRYGGWRHRLLGKLFSIAKARNFSVILTLEHALLEPTDRSENGVRAKEQNRVFREVSRASGFTVEENYNPNFRSLVRLIAFRPQEPKKKA